MLILIFEIQNTALFVYRIYHIGSTRETKATWTKPWKCSLWPTKNLSRLKVLVFKKSSLENGKNPKVLFAECCHFVSLYLALFYDAIPWYILRVLVTLFGKMT